MSDELLKKIDQKLDKVMDEVTEIKIIQAKHDINLELHMKRSDQLETLYLHLKEQEIEPIKADIGLAKGAIKGLGVMGFLASLATAILKLFGKL